MGTGKYYPNLQNPKRNLRKKASVLCFVLFLSLFTQLVNSIPPTSSIEQVDETMNAGSTAGFQAASPIIVGESINVTFETSQLPYRWFSTTGLTDNTYVNVSASNTSNVSNSDLYATGSLTAYTASSQCFSTSFLVIYGTSALCNNPSLESTVLFSIDFLNSQDSTSRLEDNLTLTISIGHQAYIPYTPPVTTLYNLSDGDLNADSETWNTVDVQLGQELVNSDVAGYFESVSDIDYLHFSTPYFGTNRLNLTINQEAIIDIPNGLSDCKVSDNSGLQRETSTSMYVSTYEHFTAIGNTLYFRATDGINGDELWKSDGTTNIPMMVKDIYSGSSSSSPADFTAVGNTLYFTASDGINGDELWKSDGTEAGTMMVKDIYSGSSSSTPSSLTVIGNTLYFQANDGTNGAELWKSDGTEVGTMMVKDIYSGYSSSSPSSLTAIGNTLYFRATDGGNGIELWKSDGTEAGTMMVKDIYSGSGDGNPFGFTAVGNTFYFAAFDGINGQELWKSDGTEVGTMMVKDIYSGSISSGPFYFTAIGNTLYFQANDGTYGTELWKSDGTEIGTMMVKDINNGSGSSYHYGLTAVGNTLYFRATDGSNGTELWKSDGTEAGTMMVKDIYSGYSSSSPSYFTAVGNTLYFTATDGSNGTELWKSDGTEAGTMMVKDIYSGSSSSTPSYLKAVGNTLYFTATDPQGGALFSYRESNAPIFEKYVDCLVTQEYGQMTVGLEPSYSSQEQYPRPWLVSVNFEQVHSFEDPLRGDSDGWSQNPPLLDSTEYANGIFNTWGDVDRYSIPLKHGTIQHIEVQTQYPAQFSFTSHECRSTDEFQNTIWEEYDVIYLEADLIVNQFSCDTQYIGDELEIQITQDTSSSQVPLYSPYILKTSTSPRTNFTSLTLEKGMMDAPARGLMPILNITDQVDGSFLHWSDQTDGYEVLVGPNQSVQINLMSNCATFESSSSNKASYIETRFGIEGYGDDAADILLDGWEVHQVSVYRLQSNNIHDVELKDTCSYTLQTSPISTPNQQWSMPYQISYPGRMHSSTPIQINDFSEYLPMGLELSGNSFYLQVPFDALPTVDGELQATQASGESVSLKLFSGNLDRPSEMDTLSVGQHIDFGSPLVQWTGLRISDLDGSALTVSFSEQPLSHYTRESLELFSIANGALGSSRDEGWDAEDTWTFNTSSEIASFASVRITSFSDNLKATFPNSGISQLVCFNSTIPSVGINHVRGDGNYALEINRGYTQCPSVSFDAPSLVTKQASFAVDYSGDTPTEVIMKVYDENLEVVYQTSGTSSPHVMTLPSSVTEGEYRLLLMDSENIVYYEHALQVTQNPYRTVQETTSHLDVNENPQIRIQSFMPHTREPVDWIFTNISIRTVSESNDVIEHYLDDEYSGLGSKVVAIDNMPFSMPGSTVYVSGELFTNQESSIHTLSWKKAYYHPLIDCEPEINPDNYLPENDILCLISIYKKTHPSWISSLTEHEIGGTLDIYDDQFQIVEQIEFKNELFHSTPIRIDSMNLGSGTYFVKLNLSTSSNIYIDEKVEQFVIGSFAAPEEIQDNLGIFDLTVISVRDTALSGDKVLLAWEITGEEATYFLVEVYSDSLIQSFYVLNDGAHSGKFQIQLPADINPYLNHRISVYAFSEYGTISQEIIDIDGMSEDTYLDVNINPDRPTIGSQIEVQLMLSNNDEWMSWNWAFRTSSSSSSEVIAQGDGFAADNQGQFKFEIPLNQYSSTPYLHLEVESEDGTIFYKSIRIEPVPLRSVNIVMDSEMVMEELYEVEWELNGQYLNTIDNIERIEFSIFTMDYEMFHRDVYFVNSTSGEFEILIPSSLNPGSHRVQIEFTFADGEKYEQSQIVTVLSFPQGLNAFGLNIPPLAMGLDTVIVSLLVIHAIFLQSRNLIKSRRKKYDAESDETLEAEKEDWYDTLQETEDESPEYQDQNESELTYPLYQEHPENSGHHWIKYSEELEWEYIEV